MIELRLFATFRENREKIQFLEIEKFPTVKEIIKYLDIKPEEIGILLINGKHRKIDDPLKDKDIVSLFPPVAGG